MHKPLTFNWNRDATGAFEEEPTKEHGRIECRRIQTMTPLRRTVNFPHIAQIFRIEREREMCKSGKKAPKLPTASLQFQRTGAHLKTCLHGTAVIGRSKTATIGCETSTSERMPVSATRRTPPFNGAICNSIALATILKRSPKIAETRRYFALNRHKAIEAVLSSG